MIGALLRWLRDEPRPPRRRSDAERLDPDELATRRFYAALQRRRDRAERRRARWAR